MLLEGTCGALLLPLLGMHPCTQTVCEGMLAKQVTWGGQSVSELLHEPSSTTRTWGLPSRSPPSTRMPRMGSKALVLLQVSPGGILSELLPKFTARIKHSFPS